MTEVEEFFLKNCKKKCINKFYARDLYKEFERLLCFGLKEPVRQRYRHPDLEDMSIKAFENGEKYFYCMPTDSNDPDGKQMECEPKYIYECVVELTVEEYEELKSKCE